MGAPSVPCRVQAGPHTGKWDSRVSAVCSWTTDLRKPLNRGLLASRNGRRLGLPHSRAVSSNRQSTQLPLHLPHMLWIPWGHWFTTSYVAQTFTVQAGHARLRNERTQAPFTKRILCLLQIYSLNASVHNTDFLKICLFSLNFQMSLKVYWPVPKSTQNTENSIFSKNTSLRNSICLITEVEHVHTGLKSIAPKSQCKAKDH